jgi:tetratricopeptide (TPR) repeat protein
MRSKVIVVGIAGVVLGFALGFLLANSINRSEVNGLRAQLESTRSASSDPIGENREALSDEEIRAKLAEADQNPDNAAFQKNLGLALYRYGALKNNVEIITESTRLLERAAKLLPDDRDVAVGSGNAWFDIGYIKKDNDAFAKARSYYEKALMRDPGNVDVRTDVGISYFVQEPPDDQKATSELKRALAADPKSERTLEFIIRSLTRQGNKTEAANYLKTLKDAHPTNRSIADLTAQIENQ